MQNEQPVNCVVTMIGEPSSLVPWICAKLPAFRLLPRPGTSHQLTAGTLTGWKPW